MALELSVESETDRAKKDLSSLVQAVKSWQALEESSTRMRCRLSRVHSASLWQCGLDQVTSSRAVQQPLCRQCLCSMGAKGAAHCRSHEYFSCLIQGDCRKEVLFIFQHQGMLYSHKSILKLFSQLPPHPKFTSQGMVKTLIFQLSWTSIYIPYGSSLSPTCIRSWMYLSRVSFPPTTRYSVAWATAR